MASSANLFMNLLREESAKHKKHVVDVVTVKRNNLKEMLQQGEEYLKEKNYYHGERLFRSVICWIFGDEYKDEFILNDLDLFSLQCCHLYCLVWLDFTPLDLEALNCHIKLPLVPYLKAVSLFGRRSFTLAIEEITIARNLLKNKYNFKSNHILNEILIPEINEEILVKKLGILENICYCEIKKTTTTTTTANNLSKNDYSVNKFNHDDDFIVKAFPAAVVKSCNDCGHLHKNMLHYDIKIQVDQVKSGQNSLPNCVINNNSMKITTSTHGTQTTSPKSKSATTQTISERDAVDKKMYGIVIDIQNRMQNLQNKKEHDISSLQKKINELHNKIAINENKHRAIEESLKIKSQEYQTKIKCLIEQMNATDKKLQNKIEENMKLKSLLQQQLQQIYITQINFLTMLEKKCSNNIEFLTNIQQHFSPNTVSSIEDNIQWLLKWKKFLGEVNDAKDRFKICYRNLEEKVFNNNYNFLPSNWPEVPKIPLDINGIMLTNLKKAMENVKELEKRIQSLEKKSPNPVLGRSDSAIPITTTATTTNNKIQLFNTNNNNSNRNFFTYNLEFNEDGRTTGSPFPIQFLDATCTTRSMNVKANCENTVASSFIEYDSEKTLFDDLKKTVVGVDEFTLLNAVYKIRDDNGGTLIGLTKEQLMKDVRKLVKRSPRTWATVTKLNDDFDIENDCCICLTVFNNNNSYTLKCKHRFHKKCIKKWLQQQSVCPMCRVHVVFDKEFPPLK